MTSRIIPLLLSLVFVFTVSANTVRFVTEDLPPLQIENGQHKPSGALVELVELLITESNLNAHIEIYPWARSYELAQTNKNTFIFSMLRSEERENNFHWIGKLFTIRSYLASLKNRDDILVNSVEDAKKYTVGSIRHDLAESYLLKKGFEADKNLYVSSKYPILWNMLYSGRTDIAFTNSIIWQHEIENAGLDSKQLKLIFEIPDFASDLYLAANIEMDKALIEKVKTSLESIKSDGRYDKIIAKWNLEN